MTTHKDSWAMATAAGGLWLLVDVQRMWTPSLITIFGRAAETPPELIGAFALACAAAPLVLLLVLPRTGRMAGVALMLLVLVRVGLLLTDGGRAQLVVSSAGTVVGLWWLALECGLHARRLVPGLAWGLLLATTAHAVLGTYGAVWRRDAAGLVETALAVGLVVAGLRRSRRASPEGEVETPGRRAAWLVLPVLLLCGVLFTNAGRASAMGGTLGVLTCVAGTVLAVATTALRPRRATTAVAGVVLVAVTALGCLVPVSYDGLVAASPWLQLPVYLFGAPAALLLLGATVAASPGGRGGPLAVAGGAVLWLVLLFVYYAGYDLGYRADALLVALSVAVAALALTGSSGTEPAYRPSVRLLAAAGVAALLLAGLGPWATVRPLDQPQEAGGRTGEQLRVVAYNLRMGYGIDGRFDARAVARLLGRLDADVILLSEIDRGWLLNGGQDQLRILARLLDLHGAFGPAADQVWGDAILSRTPLRDIESHAFDSYGAVTGAQALTATFQTHGRTVRVISTHLQPGSGGTDDTMGQAAELAELMTAARKDGGLVVAGGDLNTTPGSKPWQRLQSTGLVDALAGARPLLTAPADAPDEQIDHLFVSPGFGPSHPHALDTQLSDHLPVVVDLTLPPT